MSTAKNRRVETVVHAIKGPNNEGVLLLVLLALIIGMSIASPAFFTLSTLFAIIRSSIVPLIYALGVLLVIISGGIDVSFAAIASFAGYATIVLQLQTGIDLGLFGSFACAIAMGIILGGINGFIISKWRLPTLIVTLGTQGMFMGVLLAYVGSRYIAELPSGMASASTVNIWTTKTETGVALLHVMTIPAVVLAVVVAWLLSRTMFGRSVYAIGGDIESASRAGIRVKRTQILVYVLVGAMAATAGVIYMIMGRSANPQEIVGSELDIIAAVVLGGASIFGGRGTVRGTVLGVLLVQIINNSLILIGVPSAWQRTAVGVLLIVGVGIQALSAKKAAQRTSINVEGVAAA
ncbi:ABC transporter permease [Schaalia sp. ZJ405]|uniref:ABC transporter permease n=1 Tax=unclassified Schaalia TaxID=2691889 RepID=UPI0013EE2630|nr:MULTISPECIES: ABC transporter permease [unclassified Schaalia]QPK80898.1 ABC transporter permease [Schaalia sp. ZJ405]